MANMFGSAVIAGATSNTRYFILRKTTDNTEQTGKIFSDCTTGYTRGGATFTAITEATQTVGGAWSSGGIVEVDATNAPGLYRFDVPDAAFATGADGVAISVKATGCYTAFEWVPLSIVPMPYTRPLDAIAQANETSRVEYVFAQDSTGLPKTGLVYNTSGLAASYNRTLGARAAITLATQTVTGAFSSGGFVEMDATNMPGVYRLDVPNAVLATGVTSANVVFVATGGVSITPIRFAIVADNVYAASTAASQTSVDNLLTTAMTESYATDGATFTPAQALYQIWSLLAEKNISGTTVTCKKLDGSTTSMTLTLNSSTVPTTITRAT